MAAAGRPRSRILDRYVLSGERVVVATRHHWGMLLEPAATTLGALVLLGWLVSRLGPAAGDAGFVLGGLWLVLAARLAWKVFEWRNEWFVATDKRLLLLYGLITHKVAMMPLTKVTDLNYGRSPAGRVLGYGQFLLESAGQDQALRQIDWVAHPEATYRQICDTLFGPAGVATRPAAPAPPVPPAPPVLHSPPAPPTPGVPPVPPPPVHVRPSAHKAAADRSSAGAPTQPLPAPGPAAERGADDERGWAVSDEHRAPYVPVPPSRPAPGGPVRGRATGPDGAP